MMAYYVFYEALDKIEVMVFLVEEILEYSWRKVILTKLQLRGISTLPEVNSGFILIILRNI